VSGQLHAPAALPPGKRPGTHFIGGWVDPRAGLDDMEKWKFLAYWDSNSRPPDRPARSQSLYRLSYPGSTPPTSAEVKKMWIYTSTPPYVFMG
jgi:hypothetical protein